VVVEHRSLRRCSLGPKVVRHGICEADVCEAKVCEAEVCEAEV